jgi:demethylmenaquinone methyltransferase/2-methoxy-6-polyprenyl-1,4-benzoquinol methylase
MPTMENYYAERAAEYESIYAKPERQADLIKLGRLLEDSLRDREVLEAACGTGYWTERFANVARSVCAFDFNREVLDIARSKPALAEKVRFITGDAYHSPEPPTPCNAGVAGFWWSHVPRFRLDEFLIGFHARLAPGARVVFFDNRFVAGSSSPIHHVDAAGDNWQRRRLTDGREFDVLKNFPTADELRTRVSPHARLVEIVVLEYFWFLSYELKA